MKSPGEDVIHLNVRGTTGGAATLMRTLASQENHRIAYGYGKGGNDENLPDAIRVAPKWVAIGNFLNHSVSGVDHFWSRKSVDHLVQQLSQENSLLHLHAVHSHMLGLRGLRYLLNEFKGPIVWTQHDAWALTGRCAIPGSCLGWTQECSPCQDRSAYPKAVFDLAARGFRDKRDLLNTILDRTVFVCPSRWMTDLFRSSFAEASVEFVPNGTDMFTGLDSSKPRCPHWLWVNSDLTDGAKQDLGLINNILKAGQSIVAIGRGTPISHPNLTYAGPITDRNELRTRYQTASATVFTSSIDNAPLVVLESLAAGCPVIATPSVAATEILSATGARCLAASRILEGCRDLPAMLEDAYPVGIDTEGLQKTYSAEAMKKRYQQIYELLLV